MIVIKVELWPFGDEKSKKLLGTAYIANSGTGTVDLGNYEYRIFLHDTERVYRKGEITGFERTKRNVWDLVKRMLDKVLVR